MKPLDTKLYPFLVLSSGALFATCGCALLVLMLANIIGPFRFLEEHRGDSGADGIALWIAGMPHAPGSDRRREAWLRGLQTDANRVELLELSELSAQRTRALIVPDARALTRSDAEALGAYLDSGGGVVVTGAIGVRGADGGWLGYEIMEQMLGVPVMSLEIESASSLIAWRRGPLSAALAPDQRVRLRAEHGAPGIEDPDAELRWSGSSVRDAEWAASRRVERGAGRLVWLAADPERALDGRTEDWRSVVELLGAGVAWASRRSWVEVLPWPGGAPFAGSPDVRIGAPTSTRTPPEALAAELRHEIDRAEEVGGLAHLSAGPLKALEAELLAALTRRGAWVAGSAEVSDWRRARGGIATRIERAGPSRMRIAVTNRAPQAARGVVLRVHLNRRATDARVETTLLGQDAPELDFDPSREWVDLRLPELPGQSHGTYHLDIVAPAT